MGDVGVWLVDWLAVWLTNLLVKQSTKFKNVKNLKNI